MKILRPQLFLIVLLTCHLSVFADVQYVDLPKDVYYVKIHKAAEKIISIVASANSFLLGNLVTSNDETISLLDFDYRQNSATTVEAYDRDKHFGGWVKNKKSGDCFNTRNKVLKRDNIGTIILKPENKCSIAAGEWLDPYSGKTLTDPLIEIQIDHMVPMSEAYASGGHAWTFKERCLYGNYLGYKNHLIPVYGEENNEKSSSRPDQYLPPQKAYHCEYLKDWLKIKTFWGLTLVDEEVAAIKDLVNESGCDKADFVVTKKEIEEQAAFFAKNAELCKDYEQLKLQQKKPQQKK